MRRILGLALALAATCLPFTGTQATAGGGAPLRIAFTAETNGNLLPCPCPGNPLGGLDRRIGFLDSLRAAPGGPILIVDAGRFFPGSAEYPLLPSSERPRLIALHTAAAEEGGYDAIVLDQESGDLPAGRPWLAPNQARLIEKEGLRVAVVAVEERSDTSPAARAVRALGSADLVVLLCSGDLSLALTAAKAVGAAVAIVSRGACLRTPLWQEGVLFLGPGHSGKYVGLADCEVSGPGKVTVRSVTLRPMDAGVPPAPAWKDRVEETVLGIERSHPSALSRGE